MSPNRAHAVPPGGPLGRPEESIRDPLLAAFGADESDGAEAWEDDRALSPPRGGAQADRATASTYAPASTAGSLNDGAGSSSSSGAGAGADADADAETPLGASAAPGINEGGDSGAGSGAGNGDTAAPARARSLWSGLLNAVSRPLKNSRAAAVADGVFGNLIAKEEPHTGAGDLEAPPLPDEDDDLTPAELPPTYEEASADATPSYWETTIMTYSYGDEVIVGQMPVGSLIIFAWNLLMSAAFSYVGFVLTYLFHTTHAARGGSLAGFGVTLVQSSYNMAPVRAAAPGAAPPQLAPLDPNSFDANAFDEEAQMLYPRPLDTPTHPPAGGSLWLSNVIFIVGIVLMLKGVVGYLLALRMERIIIKRRREQQTQSEQAQSAAADEREGDPREVFAGV